MSEREPVAPATVASPRHPCERRSLRSTRSPGIHAVSRRIGSERPGGMVLALSRHRGAGKEQERMDMRTLGIAMDTLWVLVTGFLVFFMNLGFAMVEAGLCQIGRAHV